MPWLVNVTRLAGRRLTSDEMTLYLHHMSMSIAIRSYNRPAATTAIIS